MTILLLLIIAALIFSVDATVGIKIEKDLSCGGQVQVSLTGSDLGSIKTGQSVLVVLPFPLPKDVTPYAISNGKLGSARISSEINGTFAIPITVGAFRQSLVVGLFQSANYQNLLAESEPFGCFPDIISLSRDNQQWTILDGSQHGSPFFIQTDDEEWSLLEITALGCPSPMTRIHFVGESRQEEILYQSVKNFHCPTATDPIHASYHKAIPHRIIALPPGSHLLEVASLDREHTVSAAVRLSSACSSSEFIIPSPTPMTWIEAKNTPPVGWELANVESRSWKDVARMVNACLGEEQVVWIASFDHRYHEFHDSCYSMMGHGRELIAPLDFHCSNPPRPALYSRIVTELDHEVKEKLRHVGTPAAEDTPAKGFFYR